jgi:P4 family phage/plasmid primase-like protien
VVANVTGGTLTTYQPKTDSWGNPTSWKIVKGDQKGIIGTDNLFDPALQKSIKRVFKMEGCSDLLAIIPLLQPDEAAFTNAAGTNENPAHFTWLLEIIEGKLVVVIHDRDQPGVDGALSWANWMAKTAGEVKNAELPFDLKPNHGKDFRDWLNQGHSRYDLDDLITEADVVTYTAPVVVEDGADPHRLARVNLENYQEKHNRRLVFWKSEWYRWKAGKYIKIEISELRSKVTAAIRAEFELQWTEENERYQQWVADTSKYKESLDKGPPKVKKVTPQLVTAVLAAMASQVQLPGTSVRMPCWLEDRSERHYISMQNGILDFDKVFAGADENEFMLPHSPKWFSQFQLDYEFNFTSKCPAWLNYLDYAMDGDQDRINLLQEWAGYLLTPTNYLQKFLVLEGLGGNGKTVYFAGIRAMLGRENVSSVALENFSGRFDLSTTIGKQANICGDVGEIDAVAEGQLKQFTGGDCMTFDRKGMTPLELIPTAKLMMAWNLRPRFKDRSMGVWRRMMIVPFEREVEESHRIVGMDSDQYWLESGEVPAILRWAIEGLDRLKTIGKFTQPEVSKQAITEYRHESNPASEFLNECLVEEPEGRIQCQWLYELYVAWCRESGHNYPLSKVQFGKEVKKSFPKADRKLFRSDLTEANRNDRGRTWHHAGVDFSVDRIAGRYVYGDDIE